MVGRRWLRRTASLHSPPRTAPRPGVDPVQRCLCGQAPTGAGRGRSTSTNAAAAAGHRTPAARMAGRWCPARRGWRPSCRPKPDRVCRKPALGQRRRRQRHSGQRGQRGAARQPRRARLRRAGFVPHFHSSRSASPGGPLTADPCLTPDTRTPGHPVGRAPCCDAGDGSAMDFAGKVAVVTGGANGIGRAVSLGFARREAKVIVVDRAAEAPRWRPRSDGQRAAAQRRPWSAARAQRSPRAGFRRGGRKHRVWSAPD